MDYKYEILIVDDVSENIKVAISILKNDSYNFSYALSGEDAFEVLKTKRFDLILLDIMMPGVDGFKVCKVVKNTPAIKDTPIIFLSAKVDMDSIEKGFSLGASDYITKPFHSTELKLRVKNHLELYRAKKQLKAHNLTLNNQLKKNHEQYFTELEYAQKEIILLMSQLMESRSTETATHVTRVSLISKELAKLYGRLNDKYIETIFLASPLHDIGKILIDEKILHKPSQLNNEEFEIMKQHPQYAYNVLKKSKQKLIQSAAIISYQHHENYDGSGYPQGLKGEDIHIFGRIVAIADVLDALTHKRVYKEAWSFAESAKFIIDNKGKKFDPNLVDIFHNNLAVFKKIIES